MRCWTGKALATWGVRVTVGDEVLFVADSVGEVHVVLRTGLAVPHAAVADLIADSVNRYVGVFAAAPGLAQIEANVASLKSSDNRRDGQLRQQGLHARSSGFVGAQHQALVLGRGPFRQIEDDARTERRHRPAFAARPVAW